MFPGKPVRTTNRAEEVEQARLVKWSHKPAVRALMPELAWLHHSPNGGKRDAVTGGQMKALGVKADVSAAMVDRMIWRSDLQKTVGRSSETIRRWIKAGKLPPPDVDMSDRTMGWKESTLIQAGVRLA